MNTLTGEVAHDVAWARPPSIPGSLILGYNGAARPDPQQVVAWGLPFLMGFESSTTRAYAGGGAGADDSAYSCARFDEVGYPKDCGSWFCAADTPSTPGAMLPNIEEYAYQYALGQIAGGRSGPIAAYGNPAAVDAACRGIQRAGLVALRWKVGTWGMGEGPGPNQPPASADAELVQSGNTPGMVEGTDLNWLYVLTAVFCAWFGPHGTSTPKPPEGGNPMELLVGPIWPAGTAAVLVDNGGDEMGRWVAASPDDTTYGIPNAAAPFIPSGTPARFFTDGHFFAEVLDKMAARTAARNAGAAPIDVDDLAAKIAERVHVGDGPPVMSGPTEEQLAALNSFASTVTDALTTATDAVKDLTAVFAAPAE